MKDLAFNKRAVFDYELLETIEAGIVLLGVEVKSIRAGQMSLRGAFVTIHDDQTYLTNASIPAWQPANTPEGYDPLRSRRLLIKRTDVNRLIGLKQAQGLTIIPISVYNKRGHIKVAIAVAKGKKKYSKKESKKEQDIARDVSRMLRGKEEE